MSLALAQQHAPSPHKEKIEQYSLIIQDSLLDDSYGRSLTSQDNLYLNRVWSWHGREYTGAIHGLVGIYAALLISPRCQRKNHTELINDLLTLLGWISTNLDLVNTTKLPDQDPSRNPSPKKPLVQFCHGPPGIAASILTILRFSDDLAQEVKRRLEEYLLEFAEETWKKGLLTKGFSLCHGISGNGYVLLETSAYFKDKREQISASFLQRAVHFARHIFENITDPIKEPDHPYSLMEGNGGVMAFFTKLLLCLNSPQDNTSSLEFPGFFSI